MEQFVLHTQDELPVVAKALLKAAGNKKVWLFKGQMGAGKTTLIKELCKQLGVTSDMSSPTFSIVNEYLTAQGKLFHFDLYRIKKSAELIDIGFDEYLYSGNYCFVEWPDVVEYPYENYLYLSIDVTGDTRVIHLNSH